MPAVRSPPVVSFGSKNSFSPYNMSHFASRSEKAPFVRIHSPSLDGAYPGHFPSFEGIDDSQFPISSWMTAGPVFPESEVYESVASCPPSFTVSPQLPDNSAYEEPLDGSLFSWPYESNNNGYDAAFTVVPEMAPYPNAFSPSTSLVSYSPRSDHSGMSLSPQPQEFSNALNFDYSTTHDFPSSSLLSSSAPLLSHSQKSSLSHSPSPSCSSLDAVETSNKRVSKSRDVSPSRPADNDARRRFPCLILGCERKFTSQYTLKVHMEAHKPKPRTSFPCTLGCNERFSRQHDRLRHEVAKHGKVCEFSCEECGRFFSTKKTLGNHKCPVARGGTRWVTG